MIKCAILKRAVRRVKRSKIWALGRSTFRIKGNFDSEVFKVILRPFDAFVIFGEVVS